MRTPEKDTAVEGGGRDFVTALARGLQVMRAFGEAAQFLSLADVARLTGLSRATVRRSLLTLQALGYVDAREGRFRLSPQVLTIARAYLASSALPRIAQPFLERISEALGESCSVSILHGEEVIYVARSSRKRIASLHRDVGSHLPAHCTSMGRVLLAALPEAELDAYLRRALPLHAFTPRTVTSEAGLRELLAKVRGDGHCIVDGELEPDLRAIAVPVLNAAGAVIAALNVSTQASRTPKRTLSGTILPELRRAVAEMRPLLLG
jgi:IclR family pca regulon transcriptional regulator